MSAFRIPFVSTRTAMARSGRSSGISPVASPARETRDLPRMVREAIEPPGFRRLSGSELLAEHSGW